MKRKHKEKIKALTQKQLNNLTKIEEMSAEIYYLPNTAFNCNLIYNKMIELVKFIEKNNILKIHNSLEINETTLYCIKGKLKTYLKLNHLSTNPKIKELKEQIEAMKWMDTDQYGFFYEEDKIAENLVDDANKIRNSAKDLIKKHKSGNKKPNFDADFYFQKMLEKQEEIDEAQELKDIQELIDNLLN